MCRSSACETPQHFDSAAQSSCANSGTAPRGKPRSVVQQQLFPPHIRCFVVISQSHEARVAFVARLQTHAAVCIRCYRPGASSRRGNAVSSRDRGCTQKEVLSKLSFPSDMSIADLPSARVGAALTKPQGKAGRLYNASIVNTGLEAL